MQNMHWSISFSNRDKKRCHPTTQSSISNSYSVATFLHFLYKCNSYVHYTYIYICFSIVRVLKLLFLQGKCWIYLMNMNHSLLKSNSYKQITWYLLPFWNLLSEFTSKNVILIVRQKNLSNFILGHIIPHSCINLPACNKQNTTLLHYWKCVETNSKYSGRNGVIPTIISGWRKSVKFSFCLYLLSQPQSPVHWIV